MKQLFTASRARAFKKCPELHRLKYVEGWRPTAREDALAFGSLWHDGLEVIFRTLQASRNRRCVYERAYERVMFDFLDEADADEYDKAKASVLFEAYVARLKEMKFLDQFEIIAVEKEFRQPLYNPETEAASPVWDKAGKIDLVVRVKKDGRIRVIEHKTTSQSIEPDSPYWSKLILDGQIFGYVFAIARGADWDLDKFPDECGYNVVRKPLQRPAKATPEHKRKYKKDGTLYANQRDEDEKPEEYRQRLREIVMANPRDYIAWEVIPMNEHRVLEHLQSSWDMAAVIRENMRDGRALKNEHACHQYGTCPFWPVCSGTESLNDNPRYERIENKHPELEEVS